jgi:PAS domain S-box-containing protein
MPHKFPTFSRNVWLTGGLFVLLAFVFAVYVWSEKQIDRANDQRHQAFLIAEELRQSSDELTRMVRTYVATGDPVYKEYFQEILDIRDGKRPRPRSYQRIYWDFVLANQPPPMAGYEPAVASLDLMRQAGFTKQEFHKLAEAKANSDALTAIEFAAMKLIEDPGPEAEVNRIRASRMLHDDKYLAAKAGIMKPIDDFTALMDRRTADAVLAAKTNATVFRIGFLLLGLSLVVLFFRINRTLRETMGGSVDDVHAHISRVGRGDFSFPIPVAPGMKDSVLGWLAETQSNLKRIDHEHKEAVEALRRSEQRQELALAGADLGLWDWNVRGGETLFDARWCSMLGYRADELPAKVDTWISLMHPEDAAPVRAVLERYLKNEAPAYEAEFRMRHKTGRWVWILVRGKVVERDEAGAPLRLAGTHMDVTGRKLSEAALAESEARYRMLVEWSPEPLAIHRGGKVLYANPAALQLLGGKSAQEMVGRSVLDFVHPDSRPAALARVKAVTERGDAAPIAEARFLKLDGTVIDVEVQTLAFPYDGTLAVYTTVRDITERKRLEHSLRASKKQYDNLAAYISVGIYLFRSTPTGGYSFDYVSPRMAEMYQLRTEDFLKDCSVAFQAAHPEDFEGLVKLNRECTQEGVPFDWTGRIVVRGTVKWLHIHSTPDRQENGDILWHGIVDDITERKQAEEKLQLANILSDQALDLTKAGYWHVPLDGSGWYNSSERAAAIFGDNPRPGWRYRVMEEWFSNVKAGDKAAAEQTLENYTAAVEGRIPKYDATYAYKRPVDGRIVWIHAMAHVVKNAAGKATDLYGVTQDITESKLAADALKLAKDVAETASHAKSDFLATMSHEIRTPMNGVLGFTELLLDSHLDDKQRQYATIIQNSGKGLLTIINDILDLSKIEAGKIALEPQPFDLAHTIGEVIGLMDTQADEKAIKLRVVYPPNLPHYIVADSNRVRQVGLNLVGNALKFTERGSVTVRVSEPDQTGPRFLRLEIIDTGVGIPKDKQAQLFQKFVQADVSTTRRFGGTGLGLAISKRLVEAMGGQVGFDSEPGLGSTFWFSLPLVEAPAPLPSASHRPATNSPFLLPAVTAPLPRFANLRVLVAEDGVINQIFVTTLLEGVGCQVDLAVDGREAVQLFRTRPFDLVLMDCRMPEMDGFEAASAIRDYEKHQAGPARRIPIIALTASALPEEQEHCLRAGMDACLTKPFRGQDLRETLARWAAAASPVARS